MGRNIKVARKGFGRQYLLRPHGLISLEGDGGNISIFLLLSRGNVNKNSPQAFSVGRTLLLFAGYKSYLMFCLLLHRFFSTCNITHFPHLSRGKLCLATNYWTS